MSDLPQPAPEPWRAPGAPDAAQPARGQPDAETAAPSMPHPMPPPRYSVQRVTPDRPTNLLALVALVLGISAPLGGVIAGVIALAQLGRTGERGRGLAIAGIVTGAALSILSLVVAGALIAGAAAGIGRLTALQDAARSPFPLDGTGTAAEPLPTFAVGDCFDDYEWRIVPCADEHTSEIYAVQAVDGEAFPGDDALADRADAFCYGDAFADFVGQSYESSPLDYDFYAPSEQDWSDGLHRIACAVWDPETDYTRGSFRGAGLGSA